MSPSPSIPDPRQDYKGYQQSLFKALVSATAASNAISTEDIGFYRSLDRQFAKDLDICGSKVLQIANRITKHAALDTGSQIQSFEDVDDVVDQFDNVVDVVDSLLERADVCLDEMQGRVIRPEETSAQKPEKKKRLEGELYYAKNIVRPQIKFKDKVDNGADMPFVPKIRYKPHAKVPLDQIFTGNMEDPEVLKAIPHPYEHEIMNLEYPDHMLQEREPIKYHPFDETSAHWVETGEQLEKMMDDFKGVKELAIDLEHHNYRSFQGFTCLMQISTRDEDYIVDTLALRDQLWQLNEYFANPEIVKVLHGAESDIVWLQRDFGLYIVNMFDTYFATKALDYPMHSLAYLLNKFCSVEADKKYQLADWRIRPLPEEMLKYARADTHYLLYIYDCLRNTLLQGSSGHENLLRTVLQNSNQVALKKYEKEVYDAEFGLGPNGWKNLLRKWRHPMTNQQHAVFKALHAWRDHTAREEDESLRYVLPNHMLFALVERMPTESAGVLGCCNPCPPLVRMNAQALGMLIHRAKMDGLKANVPQTMDLEQEEEKEKTIPTIAPEASMRSTFAKNAKEQVDPSTFDLERIDRERAEAAAKLTKPVSALFGTGEEDMEAQLDKDLAAERLAEAIKSKIKLLQPLDGVKFITKTGEEIKQRHVQLSDAAAPSKPVATQQSITVTSVEPAAAQEVLYTRPEERMTKKRSMPVDNDEVNGDKEQDEDKKIVRVKDTMVKKKKKKNKKKKLEDNGQQ